MSIIHKIGAKSNLLLTLMPKQNLSLAQTLFGAGHIPILHNEGYRAWFFYARMIFV